MNVLRSLLDRLSGLSANLSQQLSQKSVTQYEFHTRDLNSFGLLNTINSYLPVFSHYYQLAKVHPENLYRQMAQFAGALTTFSTEITTRDIIPYQHTELVASFGALEQLINRLLGISRPQNCIPISLRKINETLVQGDIAADLFDGAQFFLAASANVPEGQLQVMLPQVLKIGPPDKIEFLIQRALRGVPVAYTARPHPAIPVKVGYAYFKLDISHELWTEIQKSKQIAIDFRAGISGFKLELFAVKD
jgi:type VI secretion system protein ImpJ